MTEYVIVELNENEHVLIAKGRLQELGLRIDNKKLRAKIVLGPNHVIEMKLRHPLFPDRTLLVIPHKYCAFGTGTGFIPVNPAHCEKDFEMAEAFNLPTTGYVNKNGKYKYNQLNDDF